MVLEWMIEDFPVWQMEHIKIIIPDSEQDLWEAAINEWDKREHSNLIEKCCNLMANGMKRDEVLRAVQKHDRTIINIYPTLDKAISEFLGMFPE